MRLPCRLINGTLRVSLRRKGSFLVRGVEMRKKALYSKSNVKIRTIMSLTLTVVLVLVLGCTRPDTAAVATETLMAKPAPPQATAPATGGTTRTEHDLLGEKQVPAEAYYGVQ